MNINFDLILFLTRNYTIQERLQHNAWAN